MYDLEKAITERRSTRLFLRDKPVSTRTRERSPSAGDAGTV
jgi:hypothetical protein